MMSVRKALLMLVVLLALGGYIYFIEFARQEEAAADKQLFTLDKDEISALTLTYSDRTIQLAKADDGTWRITQPVEAQADQTTVENLVSAIIDTKAERVLGAEVVEPDMKIYALDAPAVKLQVTLQGDNPLPVVSIGKDTPVGYSVYVQKQGDPRLLLFAQSFRLGMTKEVKDLRDKTILNFADDDVKKIELSIAEQHIVLNKTDGAWTLAQPVATAADDATVRTFLSALRGMRAQDFIEQPVLPLQELGLAPPQLAVSLTLGADDARKTLLFGREQSADDGQAGDVQRYVKLGETDTLFLVGDWVFADLNKNVNDFRDKTVAQFARDRAAKIEVKRQDGNGFILTRGDKKKWQIDQAQDGTLKQGQLNQFVTDVYQLRGFEVAADKPDDLAPYGLQEPHLTMTLYDDTGTKLAALLVGSQTTGDEQKAFAMAAGGTTVFALRDYVFQRLNKTPADFWDQPAEPQTASPISAPTMEERAGEALEGVAPEGD